MISKYQYRAHRIEVTETTCPDVAGESMVFGGYVYKISGPVCNKTGSTQSLQHLNRALEDTVDRAIEASNKAQL